MDNNIQFGASESRVSNRTYLNLRTGKLSETSKEEREGFKPFTTKNASGVEYHFYAKTYDDLVCYIKDVVWNEFPHEGKQIVGWNIILDAGDTEFVLGINSNDRPYQTVMSVLPNVDFDMPVRIVAFMGKSLKGKNQKVLLFTHSLDRTAKEWIKPKYEAKWLTRLIAGKLKDGIELTPDEQKNVAYLDNGKPDPNYPYIREKSDGMWSTDAWTEFLKEQFEKDTIPAIQKATKERGNWFQVSGSATSAATVVEDDFDEPVGNMPEWAKPMDDSEIPFGLLFCLVSLGLMLAAYGQMTMF